MTLRFFISTITILLINITFSKGQSPTLGTVCAESNEYYGVAGFFDSEFIWAVEGGSIVNGEGEDTIEIRWGYDIGIYQIEVVEVAATGCPGVPSVATVNVSAPLIDLGFDYYEICDLDSLVLDARGNYTIPYTMEWQNGTFAPTYTAKQTELIWVKVTDGNNCTRTDSVNFLVRHLPTVNLGNDTTLCDEKTPLALNAGNYAAYEWNTTSGINYASNPFYIYPVKATIDTITVVVTDQNGCKMSDTLVQYPCDLRALFKGMPNTFTPNNDEQNDIWVIPYMENFPEAVLEIFDRWGRLVYRTQHVFEEPWDGNSKGRPMPMDTYYFVLELNYMNTERISGNINLIR